MDTTSSGERRRRWHRRWLARYAVLTVLPGLTVLTVLLGGRFIRAFDPWLPGGISEASFIVRVLGVLVIGVLVLFLGLLPKLSERQRTASDQDGEPQ